MLLTQDHYEVLAIPPSAEFWQIQKAYKTLNADYSLSKLDLIPEAEHAAFETRHRGIQFAWAVLSFLHRKLRYDETKEREGLRAALDLDWPLGDIVLDPDFSDDPNDAIPDPPNPEKVHATQEDIDRYPDMWALAVREAQEIQDGQFLVDLAMLWEAEAAMIECAPYAAVQDVYLLRARAFRETGHVLVMMSTEVFLRSREGTCD